MFQPHREGLMVVWACSPPVTSSRYASNQCGQTTSRHLPAEAPGATLLATSRERLGLAGEWVYTLDGLPTPASDADTRTAPAALLFLDRAERVDHQFALTSENVPAVRRICQLVEGMPLGIELAASWVRALSCAEIAADLERGLDLLSANERGGNPRHTSLRVVFDHSWQLLTPTEQAVLARLSVFRGGATREAVAAVCAAAVGGPLLPILAALIDKSLVRRTTNATGTTRYGLHEVIRQYAAARLAAHPSEQAAAAAQHAAFYGELARTADQGIATADQHLWFQRLMAERGNLRETLTWYAAQADPAPLATLCIALSRFWVVCTSWHEGLSWIEQIHDVDKLPEAMHIWLRFTRATLLLHKEDISTARVEAQIVLTRAQQIGDASIQAAALLALANIENDAEHNHEAAHYCEQSIALFRAANASYSMVIALNVLACIRMDLGQHDEAWSLFQEAATRARALGLSAEVAEVLVNISLVAALRGDTAQIGVSREALSLLTTVGDHYGVPFVFDALAAESGLLGNYVRAGMLSGAATMLRESLNITLSPINAFYVRQISRQARGPLDDAAWEAARNAGALLSRAEAIALALADAGVPPLALPLHPPADHTPASVVPDLPDRAQSSATPVP
jgi:predicted ATPase